MLMVTSKEAAQEAKCANAALSITLLYSLLALGDFSIYDTAPEH